MKKLQALVTIFILVGMLVIAPVQSAGAVGGNNLYVATDGSDLDSNDCLTQVSPCKTILYAVTQSSSGDMINIAAGTYNESGQINVNQDLDFIGDEMNATIIDGSNSHRVFDINGSIAVTIKKLTIQNGKALSSSGGGIYNQGTLTLAEVKITNNFATYQGGGLYVAAGSALVTDSAFVNNQAESGAGIFGFTGDITLDGVEISENMATAATGGIHYQASGGTLSLINVTISTNTGYTVGALATTAGTTTDILNATIVDNHIAPTSTYGGISNYGTLHIENTFLAGNDNTQCNPAGTWVSDGYNIDSDSSCGLSVSTNDFPGQTVTYGPLGYYGGLTRTHFLPAGSWALEHVLSTNCPSEDQRGSPRPEDFNDTGVANCDIGAFEATDAPQVYSITRETPSDPVTSAGSVVFKIQFSEPVTGVDYSDFSYLTTGSITDVTINPIVTNAADIFFNVTVNTGLYDGTLRLDVNESGTGITDLDTNTTPTSLGSGFTTGEIYTVHKIYTFTVRSQGPYDGWVLESGEFSNKGGSKNNRSKILYLGDNAQNKQYRSILSFNTAGLHDKAVITSAVLKVRRAGVIGTNPMNTHNGLYVDIRKTKFYTRPTLQLPDFQAKPTRAKVGKFPNKLYSGWYRSVLFASGRNNINKTGLTQFRLRFLKDDNNDNGADILKLYSGNAGAASRPTLIITYYVP